MRIEKIFSHRDQTFWIELQKRLGENAESSCIAHVLRPRLIWGLLFVTRSKIGFHSFKPEGELSIIHQTKEEFEDIWELKNIESVILQEPKNFFEKLVVGSEPVLRIVFKKKGDIAETIDFFLEPDKIKTEELKKSLSPYLKKTD